MHDRQPPLLSGNDLQLFYEVIESSHTADTIDTINEIIRGKVRQLIPHTMTAYGIGELPSRRILQHINIGFPDPYIAQVVDKHNLLSSPVAKQWVETQKPLTMTAQTIPAGFPLLWQQSFIDNRINNILVHGLLDMTGKRTSYFSFADFEQPPGAREAHCVELLVPHLHVAITNVLETTEPADHSKLLSKRETEILKWVYQGKTNIEIGELLCISSFTVKNHIKNILDKLGAANRTHAVAKAIHLEIIDIG